MESHWERFRPFFLCVLLDLAGANYISWALIASCLGFYALGMKKNFLRRKAVVFRSCFIPQAPGAVVMWLLSLSEP